MRIGLFGGSFDPAHSGHRHVADTARRALGLDQVWWLVTPQNPLKPESSPLGERLASARAVAHGHANVVTDIETRLGVRYSVDTIAAVKKRYPGVQFVWIVGGDAMTSLHRWRRWRTLFSSIPVVIIARERVAAQGLKGPALSRFASRRRTARQLMGESPPAWAYIAGRLDPESSTRLRQRTAA